MNPLSAPLLAFVSVFLLAGCAGNERYQELQENKRSFPGFQFEDRAPYQEY